MKFYLTILIVTLTAITLVNGQKAKLAPEQIPDLTKNSFVMDNQESVAPADKMIINHPKVNNLWSGSIKIELGKEEKVFEYRKDHCATLDLPDVYAHAIRTLNGIVLVSGNAPDNYFMFGKDFNSLKRSCNPVFISGDKWEVDSLDHQEWITSVYSEDGIIIHAMVHNEYHDPFSENCKPGVTDPSNPCWYNFISYARSTDGGKTFFQPVSPNHLVAMLPFKWNPNAVKRGAPPPHGYFEPSNIIKHEGYYYCLMFGITSNTNQAISGTCIMRTDDISAPGSWKIWDGKDFNIPLVNPYTNPPEDSSNYLPAFVSHRTIRDLRGSLTWNTFLNQFILIGAGVHQVNGVETCGFFLSRSADLINWSQPQLIRETILGWPPCNRQTPDQVERNIVQEAYPSLIDHDSPDISFTTVDSTAYLYFMQNMDNWKQGGWGLRRDLVRIPLKFIKEEIPNKPALLEPEDGKVYHGACLMTYENSGDPIGPYLGALNDSTIQPAIRSFFASIPGVRGPDNTFKGLIKFFHDADSIGFIPEVSLFLVDRFGATDSIIAVSNVHDWIIDSVITLTKKYGKSSFLRIGGEFNGAGPGWNGGGYHPYIYVTMFKKIVDRYKTKGWRDSIAVNWCYEPDAANDFDSVDARGARWYPGDDYVDWFGLDVFDAGHFDQALPDYDRRGITRKGKSERFLAMAREKKKPVFLSEVSAKGVNITNDLDDGKNDWENWFEKFFEFIEAHPEIKGFAYINALWPEHAYPDWGDARIQNNSYVTQKYKEELKKPKYIHLPYKTIGLFSAIPLTEMGRNLYKGFGGGLYPDGTNERPELHNIDGVEIGKSIVPLDTNGNDDKINGKIVMLSIGMSNTSQEFNAFLRRLDTFKLKNPYLIAVNGAQGGQTASIIKNPEAEFWKIIETQRLQSKNVNSNQVQVVWLKQANANPTQSFPLHSTILKNDLKEIVKILKDKYRNLKQVYLSSRIYGGYANTLLNPEPYAFESGFAVKWLLQEQIEGDTSLLYQGPNRKSAWLSWGPYLWANGPNARKDGLQWFADDFESDGTHPSNSGRQKVAKLLLDFFSTDETSVPWFLAKPTNINDIHNSHIIISINPNPASDYIKIYLEYPPLEGDEKGWNSNLSSAGGGLWGWKTIKIYNTLGESVINYELRITNYDKPISIDISHLPAGVYYLRFGGMGSMLVKM